jgi:hypothetical protein
MSPAAFAARLADDVLAALAERSAEPEWWDGPVVVVPLAGVPVVVGVVDVAPEAVSASRKVPPAAPESMFPGWRELVDTFRRLASDPNAPTVRLLLPGPAVIGGVRPHATPRQPLKSDWIVGAANVDVVTRLLWHHGRELVELATPAIVVGGDRFTLPDAGQAGRAVQRVVRSCHRRGACLGFGGVDLGVWAVAGVREAVRLKHAGDRSSPLREVVELVERQLGGNHVGKV